MKRSKFTEQQIAYALKQTESGTPVEEVCRKMGISDATFYNWKKKAWGPLFRCSMGWLPMMPNR
jgi:putative transposase